MTYAEAKAQTFGQGYHISFYNNEPCEYTLIETKIYAVHDAGMCWTGLVSLDEREAQWTIEHSRVWRLEGKV